MKRSYDTMNDSDEEDHLLGRRTLPVANLPRNFDGVPQDGMQYLFTVRRDAKLLPKFTRARAPSLRQPFASTSMLKDAKSDNAKSANEHALPSQEWRTAFVAKFSNMRKNFAVLRNPKNAPPSKETSKLMPNLKERDNWKSFIDGMPEHVWNPPRKPKLNRGNIREWGSQAWKHRDSYDDLRSFEYGEAYGLHGPGGAYRSQDSVIVVNEYGETFEDANEHDEAGVLPTPSHTPKPDQQSANDEDARESLISPIDARVVPKQPTPALLCKMDNRYCLHLLMYFTYWIDMHIKQEHPRKSQLSLTHARWMFALLSQVDAQLSSDEMSQLRNLARSCLALVQDLRLYPLDYEVNQHCTDEPINEKACWLVTTAILEFWVQRDLWMDAENMARS